MRTVKLLGLLFLYSQSLLASTDFLAQMIVKKKSKTETVPHQNFADKSNNAFFKTHGLLLFYSSKCTHCLQFAPVVKQFVDKNGVEILPLSFDNQPIPEFEHFLPASRDWVSVAFGNKEINYPALFIINPKRLSIYPVSTGALSLSELQDRIALLIEKINAYEAKEAA